MKKKYGKNLIHIIIASAAVINLCLLVFFGYGLSDETPAVHAAKRAAAERAAQSGNTGAASSGDAEASSAVSAEDTDAKAGEDADSADGASAEAGDTGSSGAEASDGADPADAEASDDASTSGDAEPVITLSDDLPDITAEELDSIATVFRDLGYISADDGYGNDISGRITADYEESGSDPASYRVTFSVTNQAGKTATESCTLTVNDGDRPVLELTSDQITLSVGSEFNFLRYLKSATDVDGTPLDDRISLSGVVDTSTPGSYDIIYSTSSRVTGERVSKTLTVVVS